MKDQSTGPLADGAPQSRFALNRLPPTGINYAAQRALEALEVLAFTPLGASGVAATLGIHPRTARRLLGTLTCAGYVERWYVRPAVHRPTVRLLALAAQIAARLPLVAHGHVVVSELAAELGAGAALAVPSYEHVLILAGAGRDAPRPWDLLPVRDTAVGRALVTERASWRASLGVAAGVREPFALAVPAEPEPISAIGIYRGDLDADVAGPALEAACARLAMRLRAGEGRISPVAAYS
ncbi:MAG TPA: helix-turn-helix domain-containing protein [Solirubrobacteraceae bacterium]|jgi:hypothetical protein